MNDDEKINQLDNLIPKWFAIYTQPKMEKTVFQQLVNNKIETYLPLKQEIKQWSDRKKLIETPLFSSYVFAKVKTTEYYKIPTMITGFLRFVTIGGNKIAIRENEIETIKLSLKQNDTEIETTTENFDKNETIEITKGFLKGNFGKLIDFKGKKRVAIRLESLQSNIIIEIDRRYLKKSCSN